MTGDSSARLNNNKNPSHIWLAPTPVFWNVKVFWWSRRDWLLGFTHQWGGCVVRLAFALQEKRILSLTFTPEYWSSGKNPCYPGGKSLNQTKPQAQLVLISKWLESCEWGGLRQGLPWLCKCLFFPNVLVSLLECTRDSHLGTKTPGET